MKRNAHRNRDITYISYNRVISDSLDFFSFLIVIFETKRTAPISGFPD